MQSREPLIRFARVERTMGRMVRAILLLGSKATDWFGRARARASR